MLPVGIQYWLYQLGVPALIVAGIALLIWGMWGDRSRGRRRCPRCWYDMHGVATLVCPECGKDARVERRLFRARRRRHWIALACVLLAGAYALRQMPMIHLYGWWAAAPRWMLILFIPQIDGMSIATSQPVGGHSLELEVHRRLTHAPWMLRDLSSVERGLLRWSSERSLGRNSEAAKWRGAYFIVMVDVEAATRITGDASGYVLLAAASRTYAKATSFRQLATTDENGVRLRSLVAMERDVGFRGELRRSGADWHYVAWANVDVARVWTSTWGRVEFTASLSAGLHDLAANSPSGMSAIYSLLFGWQAASTWTLQQLQQVREGAAAHVDGHGCRSIHAIDSGGNHVEVFIDRKNLLIRKLVIHGKTPSSTTFSPELNVEIDQRWFEFISSQPHMTPLPRE